MKKLESKLQTKPLSANQMWGARGKRTFKSAAYLEFQNEIRDQLMGVEWPFGEDPVAFTVHAGFSNRGADLDNCIKPILDTYQSIFDKFNDNKVYEINLHKNITKKKEEYIHIVVERKKIED